MFDVNLKYLIINSLIVFEEDETILNTVNAFQRDIYHDEYNKSDSKYDYYTQIPEIAKQYDAVELTQEQLEKVTILSEEACEVFFDIMPSWGGEPSDFHVKSLGGIEMLINLEAIEYFTFDDIVDQTPLLKLKSLKTMDELSGLDKNIRAQLKDRGVNFP